MTKAEKRTPVFFDPHRKRWRITRRAIDALGLTFTIVFGIFSLSVLINPVLPSLGLPDSQRLPRAHHLSTPLQLKGRRVRQAKDRGAARLAFGKQQAASTGVLNKRENALVAAFYINDDSASFTSLKQNLDAIQILFPVWFRLADERGGLVQNIDKRVLDYLAEKRTETALMPLLNNYNRGVWEDQMLAAMLSKPSSRTHLVQELRDALKAWRFAGINIDFENVPSKNQPDLQAFMSELYAALHPLGFKVSQSLPAADPEFDYKYFAGVNDYVLLMNYDQHWNDSQPGPVAADDWFLANLNARAKEIPAEKLIMAIGSYGYDWTTGKKPHGKEVSFQEALVTARESEGEITFDDGALNPQFEYYDEKDRRHEVWFLDGVTVYNQVTEAQDFNPRGYALWRLGSEDPTLWSVLSSLSSQEMPSAGGLQELKYGYDVDYDNDQGEILSVWKTPQTGKRTFTLDPSSRQITSENYAVFPIPYVIRRYGAMPKKIALTFDDGPDPQFTPAILDILKKYKAPGAFFVIGVNAQENLRLLRRTLAEGHEIGNHTFTHPNIADVPGKQFEMELTSAQRLFESELGRRSLLFRPPYGVDTEPDTPDQVLPLLIAEKLGYKTVGERIDPKDWDPKNTADVIVKNVLDNADNGNIVLLHDGGGDRNATVQALPRIITQLRARGYQFISVSGLLGKTRDDVMPPIPPNEVWQARINRLAFDSLGLFTNGLHLLFIVGLVLGIARFAVIGSLAVWQRKHCRGKVWPADFRPEVNVIVPAYNEEQVIVRTVQALLASDYPNLAILVVDDGSQDRTYQVTRDQFARDDRVRVFRKVNSGKADTLNFGLSQTDAEIVIGLDADTVFRPDTISRLVRHFADARVGAVAGNAKVGNRINLLTRWQALEYITSQNLDRRAFDTLNCITVVPGAVGAWRTEAIKKAGGFPHETLAEDADLTITLRRSGFRIVYEDSAVALTEAPDNVSNLVKQRFRWSYGTLQAIWKHRAVLGRRLYGALGMVALPNILVFQIFFPLISPVMDLIMLETLAVSAFQRWQHPDTFSGEGLYKILFFYSLFVVVDYLTCLLAFVLEKGEDWRLVAWLFWQRFWYRQIMYYVAFKSVVAALKGIAVSWHKMERKATVTA